MPPAAPGASSSSRCSSSRSRFVSADGRRTYVAAIYAADADRDEVTELLRDQVGRIDGVLIGGPGPAFQQVNEQVESGSRSSPRSRRTVFFSALTVAGAGVALLVFPLRFLYSMGIGVILVALAAAAVSLLALPAIFAVLQGRVNALAPRRWQRAREAESRAETRGFWYRLANFVMTYRVGTALAGTLVLLVLAVPFLHVKFTGVDAAVLPESASARQVDTILRGEFTGANTSPILVAMDAPESDSAPVGALADRITDLPGAADVGAPRYLGANTWQIDVASGGGTLEQSTFDLVRDIRALGGSPSLQVGGATDQGTDHERAHRRGHVSAS